ncbi:MAG: phosphoadenylyl-sulfate reductase [Candidatus Nitrosoabyssus spongiisocia]|nr:MAG: phosphoadenylyl-sulfate reductase [Nitrosopumilaceae archaeon AB1(1)]
MSKFTQDELDKIATTLHTPQEILEWTSENLHPKVTKASSFGAEDAVLIDMMIKINPEFRFFTLDTGRLHQETYDMMSLVQKKYNLKLEVLFPDATDVEDMVNKYGLNLFYDNVDNRVLCCQVRKVYPLNRILPTLDGWITGLRNDQTDNRSSTRILEIDSQHNDIIKINPLLHWTWDDVWKYIKDNDVPYNKLLDMGYSSIGCEPCTRPIKKGENNRAGRWWWEQDSNKECGLHMQHSGGK